MGQSLFGRITPDGYADRADQWLSSGAMIARFNFASAIATNRIKGTKIDVARLLSGLDEANKDTVATKLNQLTVFGDVSVGTRRALEKTLQSAPGINQTAPGQSPPANVAVGFAATAKSQTAPAPASAAYIPELITLLIGSPEFQRR
jgi:uncharacterized protein (DUF1800 family)